MKKLACCSILAGVATLFHCGGASDAPIGDAGGAGDGTTAEAGADKDSGGGGNDAARDADASSSSSSGGGEGGGGNEGGPSDGGGDTGLAETGPGDSGTGDTGGGDTGSADTGPGDSGSVDGGAGDSGDGGITGNAQFRVAALMPSPAAIDFCWQQGGGAWNGPVMAGWGISSRLAYQQVTEYVPVPVAATTVRLVASTATDCNTSAGEVVFTPPAAGAAFLVSSFSQGNTSLQVKAFTDELTTTGATNTKLRAIHAALMAPGGSVSQAVPVDFYVGGTATATVLFSDVPFASIAPAGAGVDADGYLPHDFFTSVDLRVRLHTGATDVLDVTGFSTTGGHVYSLFTTGVHNLVLPNATPMKLVVCDDTAAAVGHLGVCSAVGTQL